MTEARMYTLALAAILLCIYFVYRRLTRDALLEDVPHAPREEAHWVFGHQRRVETTEYGTDYLRWRANTGSRIFAIKSAFFQRDRLVVTDHSALQYITSEDVHKYGKTDGYRALIMKIAGRGIGWIEGDEHRAQRKVVAPAFSASAVRAMAPAVQSCVEQTIQRVLSSKDNVVDMAKVASACIVEIMCATGFNYSVSYDSDDGKAVLEAWEKDCVMSASTIGFSAPHIVGLFPWITSLPIPPFNQDHVIKQVFQRMGRKYIAEQRGEKHSDKSILSILLREASGKMNEQTLLDNVSSFLFAGSETSATTISWTLLSLARNPKVQSKLRAELSDVVFEWSALENLPYLDAVFKEALRCHPAAKDVERIAKVDDVVPLRYPITLKSGKVIDALPVKKGQAFVFSFAAINSDPEHWGADSVDFVPERWLDGRYDNADLPRGPLPGLFSFLDGPHVCIGYRLAIMEVKMVLAAFVKTFELKEAPGVKIDRLHAPNLQPYVDGQAHTMPVHVSIIEA